MDVSYHKGGGLSRGNFEKCAILAKKALTRPAGEHSDIEYVADMENELLEKYKKGTKLYHDDYGYGQVIDCHMSDGECICLVKFESGQSKKFLPQYQGKSLMIVKD